MWRLYSAAIDSTMDLAGVGKGEGVRPVRIGGLWVRWNGCLISGIPACTSVSSRSSRALRKVFVRLIGKGLVRNQVCAEREGGGIWGVCVKGWWIRAWGLGERWVYGLPSCRVFCEGEPMNRKLNHLPVDEVEKYICVTCWVRALIAGKISLGAHCTFLRYAFQGSGRWFGGFRGRLWGFDWGRVRCGFRFSTSYEAIVFRIAERLPGYW